MTLAVGPQTIEVKRPVQLNIEEQLAKAKEIIARSQPRLRQLEFRVDEFLLRVRDWLEHQNTILDESARTIELKAVLHNAGRAPANGVDLTLRFPEQVVAIWHSNAQWGSRAQKKIPPSSPLFSLDLPATNPVPEQLWIVFASSRPFTFQTRALCWRWEVIPQGDRIEMNPIYATFERWEGLRRCALTARIRTLQPPDDHTFDIPIELAVVEQ